MNQKFTGTGWHFPIRPKDQTGRIEISKDEALIRESIHMIVMTRKGERVMRPQFGCDIHAFTFETIDYTNLKQMELVVEEALTLWEPRITDVEVTAESHPEEDGCVLIEINYVIRATNNPHNLVFPFYLTEGMQ